MFKVGDLVRVPESDTNFLVTMDDGEGNEWEHLPVGDVGMIEEVSGGNSYDGTGDLWDYRILHIRICRHSYWDKACMKVWERVT